MARAVSLFGHLQIQNNVQGNLYKLKYCDKQILFFCDKFDKYLNNEHLSLSIHIKLQGIQQMYVHQVMHTYKNYSILTVSH